MSARRGSFRLAALVATLSLGTDLGLGQPMEHVIRQTLIALRMSEALGLDAAERAVLYYSGLLAWVGCHTDAYEQAKWFGDDIALKADSFHISTPTLGVLISHLGAGKPLAERTRLRAAFLVAAQRGDIVDLRNHWIAADALAQRLGLGDDVRQSLKESFERWDGKGLFGMKGEAIQLTSRLVSIADVLAVFHRLGGVEAALTVARERRGAQFDPALVDLVCQQASMLFGDLDDGTNWETVITAEPLLARVISEDRFDDILEAIGDFTDLKSPYMIGHSRSVANLATAAARIYGLPEDAVITIRRAALVQDIGRLGISNAIWDKRGALTQAETERVRLHPYLSERMLAFSSALAPLGALAALHHERLDGSGYPCSLAGDAISPAGRILAAADTYRAMIELRPHRPARSSIEAAAELRGEVAAGRLDGDAVNAVLRAAGHRTQTRRDWPAGLTTREVEVLKLVACGYSNKEIAARLAISRKTAGNHVEHIYSKIGVSNRARASLFAMHHGLMADMYSLDSTRPQDALSS
ncbi:MAG TPA: HD domain-containing phosphohydrolase [Ktedonobacterales bacterium]|jgi:HD-GYP domain-containing protein (c-di-GMP phosphodiesterase class II)/DNA-binding CsgD family transcriptional regulator|nr:HD domain-containing phosphohydrolase [Ktedonobacterales bacterium]